MSDKKYVEELDDESVTLELDDGTSVECEVLAIFPAADKSYIALLPTTGPSAESGEVYLYRYTENDKSEPELSNIESDEEFEIVSDAFDELLDTQEYDEIVDENDIKE